MAIPIAAAAAGISALSKLASALGGPSAAFLERQSVRDTYWQTLDDLFDLVKTPGAVSADTRERIWQDWPTFLTDAQAVTVYDPVTGVNRTSTAYGTHAGRVGSETDLAYLKQKIAEYQAMEQGGSDDRLLAVMPEKVSPAPANPLQASMSGAMPLLIGGLIVGAVFLLRR